MEPIKFSTLQTQEDVLKTPAATTQKPSQGTKSAHHANAGFDGTEQARTYQRRGPREDVTLPRRARRLALQHEPLPVFHPLQFAGERG
jgi:hypothetical protein